MRFVLCLLDRCRGSRRRRLRDDGAAQAVGARRSRESIDADRPRQARNEDPAAHLHEQGSRDRRIRRRRRRVWLQLIAGRAAMERVRARSRPSCATGIRRSSPLRAGRSERPPAPAASALFAAALALPGMVPSNAAAQAVADHGTARAQVPRLSRLAAGREPDDGAEPVALHAGARHRHDWSSKDRSSTTRCRARRCSTTTRCRARPGLGVTDYRTAGDAKFTKYFNGWSLGVGRRRVVRARLPLARRVGDARILFGRPQSHVRVQHRRRERPHQSAERAPAASPTRRATASSTSPASRRRSRRRRSSSRTSPTRPDTAITTIRTSSSTSVRRSARSSRGSRATTSISPSPTPRCGCRTAICTTRSAAIPIRSPPRGSRRCRASGA